MVTDADRLHLVLGDLDTGGVVGGVKERVHGEAGACGGRAEVLEDGFVVAERDSGPVGADEAEEAMVRGVPLGGPGWVMADGDRDAVLARKLPEGVLPEPDAVAVAAPGVAEDEQLSHARIDGPTGGAEPDAGGGGSECGRVMGGAHDHRSAVAGHVVDPVGQRHAERVGREVMGEHLVALPAPGPSRVEEVSHQLALLAVVADHRLIPLQEVLLDRGEIAELPVPFGMAGFRDALAIPSQGVALTAHRVGDRIGRGFDALILQFVTQSAGILA